MLADQELMKLWRDVNLAANDTADMAMLKDLLARSGIVPGVHTGVPEEMFTLRMAAEWVLGQWLTLVNAMNVISFNAMNNVSHFQYERVEKMLAAGGNMDTLMPPQE